MKTRTRGNKQQNHDSLQTLGNGKKNGNEAPPPTAKAKLTRSSSRASASSASTTRSTRGKKATSLSSSPSSSQHHSSSNLMPSDSCLIQAMEEARYEAYVDPYRGMSPFFSISYGSQEDICSRSMDQQDGGGGAKSGGGLVEEGPSPWMKCANILNTERSWKISNGEVEVVNVDEDEENDKPKKNPVEAETLFLQCGCPTVDKWANDEWEIHKKQKNAASKKKKAGRGKKRKSNSSAGSGNVAEGVIMIENDSKEELENNIVDSCEQKEPRLICGERNPDAKITYSCDYNPFCLASLGGIVDNYRQSAAKIRHAINTQTKKKLSPSDISQLIHDNMVTSLTSSSQNTTNGKPNKKEKEGDLRRSILVDANIIQTYISQFMSENGNDANVIGESLDLAMRMREIRSLHEPLLFQPQQSVKSDKQPNQSQSGMIELSMPPGLRNLGATCYLNSQLQCLAQNLGFVHGLFSWRRPSSIIDSSSSSEWAVETIDGRMSNVISNMQSILARMRYGPERVICTNEFASALNLENDEMQDPNEFARLLFDRMSESFRRSDELTLGSNEQNGLGDLLPSLFGGTFTYVTTCFECNTASRRREDFMELTVPIVDCCEEEEDGEKSKKQRGKTKQASNNSSKTSDIDVQLCLNRYLDPERLNGDNQYECSACLKKCDAIRSVVFEKLPPVLNIQLARYIFDMETFSKRKLTTKVQLPKALKIPDESTTKPPDKYILCAVQNHLGNSAHGGHYIAEVMDWTSGVWHEFNDEEVTILEAGPSSSFEPSERNGNVETNGKKCKVTGSTDAYNLFYVAESYLSAQCESEFLQDEANKGTNTASNDDSDILTIVKNQRNERYKLELEIQTKNMWKARRISARQEQIMKEFFLPTTKLANPTNSDGCNLEGDSVWVSSHFLRRFFSCEDGMEDLFHTATTSTAIISSQPFFCEHSKGLHPRVARIGKLLPSEVYNILEKIMQKEYAMFLKDQGSDSKPSLGMPLSALKFVDGSNLICQDCGVAYQQETRNKLDLFKTLLSIHDDLMPGRNDLEPCATSDSPTTYVISRTWATSFRKYVEKKMNQLKIMPQKKSSQDNIAMPYGGIDNLDLSEVNDNQSDSNNLKCTESFKGEDPTSKITCQHSRCPLMNSRKSVRFIPVDVWLKINKIFPDATPHYFELPSDDAVGNCLRCHLEKEEEGRFPEKLNDWKSGIMQCDALQELLKRGKHMDDFYPPDIGIFLNEGQTIPLHAVHSFDVQRWRDSFNTIEKSLKSRKKNETIKNELYELLFDQSESCPSGLERKFRQLICREHGLAVGVPLVSDSDDVESWLKKLYESNVELLLQTEYDDLINSLSTLESILYGNESDFFPYKENPPPTVSIKRQRGRPIITVDPKICTSGCGVTSFSDECIENGKIVSKPTTRQSTKLVKGNLPIEERPKGPLCKAIIYEVENDMDIDVAASQIISDLSSDSANPTSSNGRPRRSRKARGEVFSDFPIYEIEMALDGNLAHFRLLLHQSKNKNLIGQRLYLLHEKPSLFCGATEELPFNMNTKTIMDIVAVSESAPDDEVNNAEMQKDCTIRLILSYNSVGKSNPDGARRSTRKRLSQEDKAEEEQLIFSLTEIACGGWKTADASEEVIEGKNTKRRRRERGFQGTFLQSHQSQENQPLLPATKTSETVQHGELKNAEVIIPNDKDIAKASNGCVAVDSPEKAQPNCKEEVLIIESPEPKEDVTAIGQRVNELFAQALQGVSGSEMRSMKKKVTSQIMADRELYGPRVRNMVREALIQHIETNLEEGECEVGREVDEVFDQALQGVSVSEMHSIKKKVTSQIMNNGDLPRARNMVVDALIQHIETNLQEGMDQDP